jgi:Domain of unknown function (DUF4174)
MKHILTIFLSISTVLLTAQQSNYRRILIFAPDSSNISLKTQNQIFKKSDSGCVERNIIVENHIFKSKSHKIFDKYQISTQDFTIILIGKDGFVKLRSKEIVSAERIYALVDAMPMRKDELRKMKKQ